MMREVRIMSEAPLQTESLKTRVAVLAGDIKLSHTVFAMPWAILATFLAASPRLPALGQIGLIVACMVVARTGAMAANRLLDARLDSLNPRTARRAIPSGKLSSRFVALTIAACGFALIVTTSGFGLFYNNWIPLIASVPVYAFICAYPLMKRYTRWCHYYLGTALALAPVCAWAAIAGTLSIEPLLMFVAVLLWTAGFDIIYACQDFETDRATGVYSVPARMGIPRALWMARCSHLACVGALVALGLVSIPLHVIYFVGVGIASLLLFYEHTLVRADDLSKVNLAFFTLNGIIALTLGTLGIVDILL